MKKATVKIENVCDAIVTALDKAADEGGFVTRYGWNVINASYGITAHCGTEVVRREVFVMTPNCHVEMSVYSDVNGDLPTSIIVRCHLNERGIMTMNGAAKNAKSLLTDMWDAFGFHPCVAFATFGRKVYALTNDALFEDAGYAFTMEMY